MSEAAVTFDGLARVARVTERDEVGFVAGATLRERHVVVNVFGRGGAAVSLAQPAERFATQHEGADPLPVAAVPAPMGGRPVVGARWLRPHLERGELARHITPAELW